MASVYRRLSINNRSVVPFHVQGCTLVTLKKVTGLCLDLKRWGNILNLLCAKLGYVS